MDTISASNGLLPSKDREIMRFLPASIFTASLIFASASQAITVTELTHTENNSECSLQEAIAVANSNVASNDCPADNNDVITIHSNLFEKDSDDVFSDIEYASIELDPQVNTITDNLTIQAPNVGEFDLFVDAYLLTITFNTNPLKNSPIFQVSTGTQLTLENIIFDGTSAPSAALATLHPDSELNLDNIDVMNFGIYNPGNSSTVNSSGLINTTGAENTANIKITDSRFYKNYSEGNGTILRVNGEKVIIKNSKFESNRALWNGSEADGGSIAVSGNTVLEISDSLFARNSAEGDGGAIANLSSTASIKIENTNFLENFSLDSGGAIYNQGQLNIYSSTLLKNKSDAYKNDNQVYYGGAIFSSASSASHIYNSLLAYNYLYGSSTISDCAGDVDVIEYSFINSSNGCNLPANTGNSMVDVEEIPSIYTVLDDEENLVGYGINEILVDAANPAGCIGMNGTLLLKDINGNRRENKFANSAALCDIGSTEMVPLAVTINADNTNYPINFDSSINNQTPAIIKLTIKNTGNTNLEDLNVIFTTPDGFSVKSGNSVRSGQLQLFFDVDIAPGAQDDVNIAVVAINENVTGSFTFEVFSENPYVSKSPLYTATSTTVQVNSSGNNNQSPSSNESSSSSSSGGAIFLLPLLALLRRKRNIH